MRSFAAGMLLAALLAFLPRSDAQVPPAIDDDDLILLIIAANKAPGAAFTSPSNNAQFPASGPGANIPLTINATDFEGKIAKVEIFRGATSIKTFVPTSGFLAPGSFLHTDAGRPAGSYGYKAVVTDHLNKTAEATVSVTVTANTPPSITTIGPATISANINTSVPLQVNATDAQGQPITVQFFDALTGALIGNGSQSGSTYTLNWSANTEGVHSIRAMASDGIDQSSTNFVVAVMRTPAATGVYSSKATSTVGSIAGTFVVSESGAATYSIPIPVPPGAAGVQPALALSYSSQGGNGPLGMGWGVSGVSTITRCPTTVATDGQRNGINYDNIEINDAYCLDGQRLVAVDALQTYGAPHQICDPQNPSNNLPPRKQEYRTELDSYAKIIAYEDSPCLAVGPSRFEVHTKSGQLLIFGVLSANTYGDSDYGVSVTSWPTAVNQPGRVNTVKLWPLVRSIDRAGNFIRYEYCGTNLFPAPFIQPCNQLPQGGTAGDVPNVGAFPPTEHHLKRVLYGGRINPISLQVVSPPIANVTLVYGERGAQDQQRVFDSGGGETTLTKYLRSITTSVDGTYAQSYVFGYEGSTATNRVRLVSVTQCAGGINAGASPTGPCLTPTIFNYTPTVAETPGFHGPFVSGPAVPGNNQDANAAGDLDGDGKTDLIYVPDNTSIVRVALSSDNFAQWTDRSLGLSGVSRGSERYLADFNGDGKADLVLRASDGSFRFCDLRLGTSFTTADCKNPSMPAAAENFYLQGDFDGDGRIDFLLFRGMIDNVYTWDIYLGDPATGVKTTPIRITNLPNTFSPSALEKHFAVGDFNGDGRADLIFRKAASVCNIPLEPPDDFKCSNASVKWNVCFSRPGSTPGSLQFNCGSEVDAGNGLLEKSITIDFNGDGLADLAYPAYPNNPPAGADLTHWNICLSAGDGSFQRPNSPAPGSTLYSTGSLCKIVSIFQAQPSDVVFGDFDGDGKSDMARHVSGPTWRVCLARTDGISSAPNNVSFQCANWSGGMDPNGSAAVSILSGDFNGDGKTDIFSYRNAPFQFAMAPAGMPDLLRRVENGLHATTQVNYLPLTRSEVYSKGAAVAGANEVIIQSPLYVVHTTQESNGIGGTFDHTYGYTGFKGATNGRGLLGFFSKTVTDSSGLKRETEYNQSVLDWWKAGRPSRVKAISSNATGNIVLSDAKSDWRLLAHEWPQVYRVHMVGTLEAKRDLDNSALPCSRMTLYDPANGVPQVDIYGNVLLTVTETGTACNVDTGSFTPDGFRKVTTNTYAPVNPADWQIGRLARASVQHIAPNKTPVTRTSAFTYHNLSGGYCSGASAPYANLCSEVVEPDEAGDLRLETRYEYDVWGNVAMTRLYFQEGLDTVERRASVTFDPNGRFAQRIAKKNVRAAVEAGEHVETRTYDARTGGVISVRKYFGMNESDPRSIIATTFLDDFGRIVGERTTSDDGNKLAEADVTWNAEPPGTNIAYSITTVTHTGARTKVYYDTLQREVARDIRGFIDPQNTRVDTTYDTRGRKASATRPAGNGTMTTTWGYDELDRAVSETTSGNGGITSAVTTTLKGLATVVRRTNGTHHDQKAITQRDSQGQVTSVSECLADASHSTSESDTVTCTSPRRAVTTTYGYDATGHVISIRTPSTPTNPAGIERTAEFDKRGRKKWSIDPDEGRIDFAYSGIGQLIERRYEQTAGVPIKTTFIYDDLGRLYLEKTLNSGATSYERRFDYDVCGGQERVNGHLCSTTQLRDQTHFLVEDHFADRYGRTYRSSRVEASVRDDTYTLFDPQGRPSQTIHPSLQGFTYEYVPNGSGGLKRIRDARNPSIIHWEASARHDDGQIQAMAVGGVTVTKSYDGFGRPSGINANNGVLQSATYTFDPAGNLRSRVDTPNGLALQTFTYDSLHRVISGGGVTMAYDDAGNIASRDGTSYTYQPGSNRISVINGNSYTFDNVGNLKTAPGGLVASWTPENLPLSISKGGQMLSWLYDVNRKRYKEFSSATGTTEYFPGMERVTALDGSIRHKHFIATPEGVVGIAEWVVAANGTTSSDRRYWLRDHLGSTVGTFDAAGNRQETFGYSVWGQRTGAVSVNGGYTQRGFTGHEMLDEIGLVHMNGRIYDPAIGRFLSPDPVVEAPFNGQSWNRYSYVFNNPLSATDPTGYSSWWVQWRRPIGAIAAAALLRFEIMPGILAQAGVTGQTAALVSNTVAGFAAGGIAGGNIHSALQGAFFANVSFAIGQATPGVQFLNDAHLLNTALHGLAGCASQAAAGGNCRAGLVSGAFGAFAAPVNEAGLVGQIVIGAVASKLAGGKAQNGAMTVAFEYLFNCLASKCNPSDFIGKSPGHTYEPFASPVLCNQSNPKCMPAAINEMACYSAPGQPACVPIGRDVPGTLSRGNPVTQYRPNEYMIINGTSEGHRYHDGMVVRWIGVDADGGVRIWTWGIGTNSSTAKALENYWLGAALFKGIGRVNASKVQRVLRGY